jgi:hypothetical protein
MYKQTLIATVLAAALAGPSYAEMTRAEVNAAQDRISADYKAAKARCDNLSGNTKDICMAEAKAKEKVAKAELDARKKNYTPQARHDLNVARAEANYDVAKQKCDEKAGNDKDVCMKDAKAALTAAKADAKVQYEANKGGNRANERVSDARNDATQDKRRAEFQAARERCDAYTGDAKDRCVNDAKNRYGMN